MGFGGLTVATSGMRVAQRNLNITGHNMTNAEVPGFSRQRLIQKFAFQRNVGVGMDGSLMQIGMGADWTEVHQIRNEFLDVNFRNNVSQLQFYSTKVQAGIHIETLLGELHGADNFQSALNRIWFAIQELTTHPQAIHTRQFFISNATTFLRNAQHVFEGLFEYQLNLDSQIREMVNGRHGINATVAAIGELNDRIRFLELGGEMANDYRDERNRLIDHLATMIPIDVHHSVNGDINITSLGHHILSGSSASPLGLRHISRDANLVEVVFTHETSILPFGTPPDEFTPFINYRVPICVTQSNDRGRLLALLQARGTIAANHLSQDVLPPPTLQEVTEYLNTGTLPTDPERLAIMLNFRDNDPDYFIQRITLARDGDPTATPPILPAPDYYNTLMRELRRHLHAQAHNHSAHMWSLENAKLPQVMMNLDRIVNTVVTMINDALTGNLRGADGNFLFFETDADGNPLLAYETDADGNYIYVGGYRVPIIDPVTGEQARIPIRPVDANGQFGRPLFVREMDLHLTPEERANIWPLNPPQDPNRITTIFSIHNLRINPDFEPAGGHNHLALSLSGAEGDTDLLVALQEVWMDRQGFYSVLIGERRFNIQDAYIRFTGNIATETAEAASKVTSQTIQVDQAQNQRMAVKGVSMDEEMAAMLRFQFAFQAASRVFNMIDQMIDRVVNGTGRVGL